MTAKAQAAAIRCKCVLCTCAARVLFAGGAASTAFAFVWERVLRAGAVGQTGAGGGTGRRRRLTLGRILGAVGGIALGGCSGMLVLFDMERVIRMSDRIDSLLCTLGAGWLHPWK